MCTLNSYTIYKESKDFNRNICEIKNYWKIKLFLKDVEKKSSNHVWTVKKKKKNILNHL